MQFTVLEMQLEGLGTKQKGCLKETTFLGQVRGLNHSPVKPWPGETLTW